MKTPDLTPSQIGILRLLELAEILDRSQFEYKQRTYASCGSPACALGHWAYHHPDRWHFGVIPHLKNVSKLPLASAQIEFDLNEAEVIELFGLTGCARARFAREAANYIRRFVARKLEQESGVGKLHPRALESA